MPRSPHAPAVREMCSLQRPTNTTALLDSKRHQHPQTVMYLCSGFTWDDSPNVHTSVASTCRFRLELVDAAATYRSGGGTGEEPENKNQKTPQREYATRQFVVMRKSAQKRLCRHTPCTKTLSVSLSFTTEAAIVRLESERDKKAHTQKTSLRSMLGFKQSD